MHGLGRNGGLVDNEESDADYFFVKCDGKIEKVMYSELIYVEAMSNCVILRTVAGQLIVYLTIKGILESLPATKFLQVHKSYIVNTKRVNTIEGNVLHLGTINRILKIGISKDKIKNYDSSQVLFFPLWENRLKTG